MHTSKGFSRRYPIAKVKGGWTEEEDAFLRDLVIEHGEGSWSFVAESLNSLMHKTGDVGRIGKQCRERWTHHLRPDLKKDPWSNSEEFLLVSAHKKLGNRWSDISKMIPGRSENSVKNHWNAVLRRKDWVTQHSPLRCYMQEIQLLPILELPGRSIGRKRRIEAPSPVGSTNDIMSSSTGPSSSCTSPGQNAGGTACMNAYLTLSSQIQVMETYFALPDWGPLSFMSCCNGGVPGGHEEPLMSPQLLEDRCHAASLQVIQHTAPVMSEELRAAQAMLELACYAGFE
ncbi:hypothetical protein CEUSTIGMA_g2858.t1 [Chlamydomonas eustigma]|uniref:Uncharacterized protein n=1 Tax=Chlamydomonas eustigma TaxID=1157962 RepID=A0A250WX55_9CHLO|nr:hypothetical protein CEUSTIGMA_g2858.t1 [Chlamydomonas eustigma]|eukprot:GAX75414.1 hypothetical protein CEUSTIGMA_g2858.t1 [Chlamydomonas eustigma]